MMLPIIISYSKANLNSIGKGAQEVLKELSGEHSCQFHYYEPQNGYSKVRLIVLGSEWNMVVELGKDLLNFTNPWFRKSRTMEAIHEDDCIVCDCDIIFIDKRISPVSKLLEIGKSSVLPEIHDLLLKCKELKRPIVRPQKDKDKEIWTAYCDGLNALNKERRNFISVNYVGTPILYNDTREGEIYTMKLGIGTDVLDNIPSKLGKMLSDKYNIKEIKFNSDGTQLDVRSNGIEHFLEYDLDGVSEYLRNFGFIMSDNGVINLVKASVSWEFVRRTDLYDKLDARLKEDGVDFSHEQQSNKYYLKSDTDANYFIQIANDIFEDSGYAEKVSVINLKLGKEVIKVHPKFGVIM